MKIKKISKDVVYEKIVEIHTFDVNGKKVRVEYFKVDDEEMENYDQDTTVLNPEVLTEEESELFNDDLNGLLDLKEGETEEIE